MRIYDGSPRQDWEEVLRSIGAFARSASASRSSCFLELEDGFILQGLAMASGRRRLRQLRRAGQAHVRADRRPGRRAHGVAAAKRGTARPTTGRTPTCLNYYELSLRILGAYIDSQKAHDVFFLEQEGTYVLRLFGVAGSHGAGHQLTEFTRDEMLAMIESAPEQPRPARAGDDRRAVARGDSPMKAVKVLLISIGAILAALIVIPLTILAGLFVWLKLTEETDDEEMELDDTI